MTPSPSLARHLADALRAHEPFARLAAATIEQLLAACDERYFAPDEIVLGPKSGAVERLLWIRRGAATASTPAGETFHIEAGDLFPMAAVIAGRAVTSTYRAEGDLFCLAFDAGTVRRLAQADPVLADHVNRRLQSLVALSRVKLQASMASAALAEQSFEAPLATLPRRVPVAVGPQATVHAALSAMQRARVGSVLVLDAEARALGILTRHDLLDRVALREPPPDARTMPITALMSAPVQTLDLSATVHEAALLMSRRGLRHVPLTDRGRVVSIVSERDLFALQRLSMHSISDALRHAVDVAAVQALAPRIRAFARHLLGQGLAARTLTALVSHLNDLLTQRLVALHAADAGLDLRRAAWLAFGSEGRGEQTIATDQDNGLLLDDGVEDAEVERWQALGRAVNLALDAAGYPLCKGGIMAGEPGHCLHRRDWVARIGRWIDRSEPEDLLHAAIYFDMRALAGADALVAPLQTAIARASAAPRFLRALAQNSLRLKPALNWRGAIDVQRNEGRDWVDLKLNGSAIFVDAGRLLMLASGGGEAGGASLYSTRERLLVAGERLRANAAEREAWVSAFEMIQTLRLQAQIDTRHPERPNHIVVADLNDVDRRLLKEALTMARRLQQRIELDLVRA